MSRKVFPFAPGGDCFLLLYGKKDWGKKRSQIVWDSFESFLLHCSLDSILFPPGGGQAAEAVAHASHLITAHEAVPAPIPACGSETGQAPGKQACRWLSGRSGRHTPRTRAAGAVTYPAQEESIFGHGSLVRILFLEKGNVCSPKTGGFFFRGNTGPPSLTLEQKRKNC